MKKAISLFLLAVLVFTFAFSGCLVKDGESKVSEISQPSLPQTSSETENVKTLTASIEYESYGFSYNNTFPGMIFQLNHNIATAYNIQVAQFFDFSEGDTLESITLNMISTIEATKNFQNQQWIVKDPVAATVAGYPALTFEVIYTTSGEYHHFYSVVDVNGEFVTVIERFPEVEGGTDRTDTVAMLDTLTISPIA